MPPEIKTMSLSLPFRLGRVNCYLLEADTGYILIDTGSSNKRADLEKELAGAGCGPGSLKLIVLTHGDFDHTGNAAYLRGKFGAPIAMHRDDSGMLERGDMFWNRNKPNLLIRIMAPIFRMVASILFGFGKAERCTPDLYVEDGDDLAEYGLAAKIRHLPGHSRGSIGVLTASGDLFCGDLLDNTDQPVLNAIIDDRAAANASVEKLTSLAITTVYPGHGRPFPLTLFLDNYRKTHEGEN